MQIFFVYIRNDQPNSSYVPTHLWCCPTRHRDTLRGDALEASTKSVAEPFTEPIAKPFTEPIAKPFTESIAKPFTESIAKPFTESTTKRVFRLCC